MRRVFLITLAGLGLAGCGSMSLPGMDMFKSTPPEAPLKLESTPPGADARTSLGPGCKTPCVVSVPTAGNFTVTFSLDKHQPQTVPVQIVQGVAQNQNDSSPGIAEPTFDPNPVYVELQPTKPVRAPAKKKSAPKPRAATAPASSQAPSSGFPQPPAASSSPFPPPPPQR